MSNESVLNELAPFIPNPIQKKIISKIKDMASHRPITMAIILKYRRYNNKTGGVKMRCKVDMRTRQGYIMYGLDADIYEDGDIYFRRNKDGVGAWHCGRVNKNDYNVIRIQEEED